MPQALPLIVMAVASVAEWGAVATALAVMAASVVAGAIEKSMAKSPSSAQATVEAAGFKTTTRSTTAAHRVIYGEYELAGNEVFAEATGEDNKILWLVQNFCEGEIAGISQVAGVDQVFADGNLYNTFGGKLEYFWHNGTATQNVDAALHAAVPKWTDCKRLTAYGVFKLTFDSDKFQGKPEITVRFKGRKVYDYRTGVTAWSDNLALCAYDWFVNTRYGLGNASTLVDLPSWISAANYCDTKGWHLNMAITDRGNSFDTFEEILKHFRAQVVWSAGKFKLVYSDLNYESTVKVIGDNEIVQGVDGKAALGISQPSRFGKAAGLLVKFVDKDKGYSVDTIPVGDQTGKIDDFSLLGSTDKSHVGEIATYFLERMQLDRAISGTFRDSCLGLEPHDLIDLTCSARGLASQQMRVMQKDRNEDGTVYLALAYEDDALYDKTYNVDTEGVYTCLLPTPFDLPAPTDLLWDSTDLYSSGTGTLSWTASASGFVSEYEVEYLPPGASIYLEHPPVRTVKATFENLAAGTFTFRVRAKSAVNTHSDWSYLVQDITIPNVPNVSGLVLVDGDSATTFTGGTAKFAWTATSLSDRPGHSGAGPWFSSYKVEIVKGSTVVRTEYPKTNTYDYTFEKNSADGGASRGFTARVYVKGDTGIVSAAAATLAVSNPAPTMAGFTPVATAAFKGLAVDWSSWSTTDADHKSFLLYCDTSSTPSALVAELLPYERRWLIPNLEVGSNYKVMIVPTDAFGSGTSSGTGNGTPLILAGTDVDVALTSTITMTDSDLRSAAQLAPLYDRVVDAGGVAYTLSGVEKHIRYQFGMADYIDKIILHVGGTPCRCYIRYSADGLSWSYLKAEDDHTLTATGTLVAGTAATAPTAYWQTSAGLNVALFPARAVAKYCELVMVGSYATTIYELVFARIKVAEEMAVDNLSAISVQLGTVYSTNYVLNTSGFMLNGATGSIELNGGSKIGGVLSQHIAGWAGTDTTKIKGGSIECANLSTINAYTGELTVDNWLTIGTGGGIKCGKTAYGSGTGYLWEANSGSPRVDIGDSTQYLRYSAGLMSMGGDIVATGNVKANNITEVSSYKNSSTITTNNPEFSAGGTAYVVSATSPAVNTVGNSVLVTIRLDLAVTITTRAVDNIKVYLRRNSSDYIELLYENSAPAIGSASFAMNGSFLDEPASGDHTYSIVVKYYDSADYIWVNTNKVIYSKLEITAQSCKNAI